MVNDLEALCHAVIRSSLENCRKPSPTIYNLACTRLNLSPDVCVFLDDIGANLKAASALGMRTIKVEAADAGGWDALDQLSKLTGVSLVPNKSTL
jgi:epoxide hydrolase-like predicted phosphatase